MVWILIRIPLAPLFGDMDSVSLYLNPTSIERAGIMSKVTTGEIERRERDRGGIDKEQLEGREASKTKTKDSKKLSMIRIVCSSQVNFNRISIIPE